MIGETILEEWKTYERQIVPVTASAIQREECRRAFYAGACSMRALVFQAVEGEDPERNLRALDDEVNAMPKDLRIT